MSIKRITVAGWPQCGAFRGAKEATLGLQRIFPNKIQVEIMEYETRDLYMDWLLSSREAMKVPTHATSPLVWFRDEQNAVAKVIGGRDDTLAWARSWLGNAGSEDLAATGAAASVADGVTPDHGFDYDLVVIGGGSGGLSTGREAAKLGAKVAILDFVKPSPAGSVWGLGGTCVNVGCIPKKLMHNAALLGEHSHASASYGWEGPAPTHNWVTLRQHVQDHIKGLNFGYKVALREEGITYLNKLGKFVDAHTLECTDNKGKVDTITAARFVVAVGGRPIPLSCPGGEHAITSDDLFMRKTPPGKTCVVGAGYVALECAGFITGLKQGEVTVLVRSLLLRGFDREIVAKVQQIMEFNGTKIRSGVLPVNVQKLESGRLLVTMDNGESDEFDTLLVATGRYMDLQGLGCGPESQVPLLTGKNGKLICVDEQTSIPNIYAVGDVVEHAPELTPVAIQAGQLLARRLYGGATEKMIYKNVATTVFTPLELGTVGLSEEEAISKYGEENVDCYVSSFQPLEWSIIESMAELRCIAKVVVDKSPGANLKVLGMHIGAPNAGEIIQGFGVAFRKGNLHHKDLLDTVGIHPTTAEEFVGLTVAKSSGLSTEKAGC
jgi:thioredoxin/glutathione reductase (selenoprotein)